MGKFSKIYHHISKEDLKRVHEQKVRAQKLEREKIEEERKEIKAEFEQSKFNWRKDISESDFTNITKGNTISQTFQHTSGATITLDNTMSDTSEIPTQVTLDLGFGEKITVDAPGENEYGIAGVTKPLDKKVMQKQNVKTAKEINDQLDASKKVSGVDTAKVDVGEDDLGYKSTDEILADVGDQWTYPEYMAMLDAIADKAAAAEEPIAKAIAEYSPTGSTPGDVPISLIDAQEAITNARHKAEQALHQAWERYNKVPDLPPVPDEQKKPTGLARVAGGFVDALTGGLTDLDKRGGEVTGASRVVGGIVDALTGNRTDLDKRGGEQYSIKDVTNAVNASVKSVWDGTASKSISQNNRNESRPERLKRFFTGVADLYVNTGLRIASGPFTNISNKLVDFDKRGTVFQGLMKAGTNISPADRYKTPVNFMLSLDKFLKDFSNNKNIKGSTWDNPLDMTGSLSKDDINFIENRITYYPHLNSSLEILSKSDSTSSEIDAAKSALENGFFTVYSQKAGLIATFGGTGKPKTGDDPALPRVLDVRDRGDYYEVDYGKSYAFRPGGSEPNSPFLKFLGIEPDTIGSDTFSFFAAPIAAKFGIVNDEKFRKKGSRFNLYNSPDMYYKVTIRIKKNKKKEKKVNESNLFSKIKIIRNK